MIGRADPLSDGVIIDSRLGTTASTAIVHPRTFTTAVMRAAQGHGAGLRRGRVTGIVQRAPGQIVRGVEVDGGVIEADAVVIALGPWSLIAAGWLGLPAMYGQRSPSLTGGVARSTDLSRCQSLSSRLVVPQRRIIARQASSRQVTQDGPPLIGNLPAVVAHMKLQARLGHPKCPQGRTDRSRSVAREAVRRAGSGPVAGHPRG